MASQPKTSTTETGPWKEVRDENIQLVNDAMKEYNKDQPLVWGEQNGQNYIAPQSDETKQALNQIEKISNQDPAYIKSAIDAQNDVSSGKAFGNADDKTLVNAMKGVNFGSNAAANAINNIADGNWNGKDPGAKTMADAQKFNIAGDTQTADVYKALGNSSLTANGAIGQADNYNKYVNPALDEADKAADYKNAAVSQAANLDDFKNAGMNAQQRQVSVLQHQNNPALKYLTDTASGANIMGDPTLNARMDASDKSLFSNYMNITKPKTTSAAMLAGRNGSGAQQFIENQGLSDVMTQAANARNNMMADVYKTGAANQMAAANSIGSLYNSDVENQRLANADLANTSNSQQNTRISGINTYGGLNDSQQANRNTAISNYGNIANQQQSQRLAGTELYGNLVNTQNNQQLAQQQARLAAAGQMGDMSVAQNQQRMNAATANNDAYYQDRANQMQALGMQNTNYQNLANNLLAEQQNQISAANAYSKNQNADAQARLQSASMAGDQRALDYFDPQQLAAVGAQKDARSDAELLAQQTKFNTVQAADMNRIANTMGVINGNNWNTQTATTPTSSLGTIGSLASVLGGLFSLSDERTKTNIKPVGNHPSGLKMYEYSYKGDNKKYVGPMAQDVEKLDRKSVFDIGGVKFMDNRVLARGVR